jgi:hypothetical protein
MAGPYGLIVLHQQLQQQQNRPIASILFLQAGQLLSFIQEHLCSCLRMHTCNRDEPFDRMTAASQSRVKWQMATAHDTEVREED